MGALLGILGSKSYTILVIGTVIPPVICLIGAVLFKTIYTEESPVYSLLRGRLISMANGINQFLVELNSTLFEEI